MYIYTHKLQLHVDICPYVLSISLIHVTYSTAALMEELTGIAQINILLLIVKH